MDKDEGSVTGRKKVEKPETEDVAVIDTKRKAVVTDASDCGEKHGSA